MWQAGCTLEVTAAAAVCPRAACHRASPHPSKRETKDAWAPTPAEELLHRWPQEEGHSVISKGTAPGRLTAFQQMLHIRARMSNTNLFQQLIK